VHTTRVYADEPIFEHTNLVCMCCGHIQPVQRDQLSSHCENCREAFTVHGYHLNDDARLPARDAQQLVLSEPTPAAYELAARFHPAWSRLTRGVRALHARNCHQVLGADLASPARFVLCWTPDGSLDGRGRNVGGTGQALRIAHHHGIAIFNLARPKHAERLSRHCIGPTR
jgi:hypothetical protein